MGTKSLRWFLFTILVPPLPLIFSYHFGNNDDLWKFISSKDADILFMGVTFCVVGIGELLESATSNITMPKTFTNALMGGSIFVVIFATLLYAGISLKPSSNNDFMTYASLVLFGISIVLSTGCIALSEYKENEIVEAKLEKQSLEIKQDCGTIAMELINSTQISEDDHRKLIIQFYTRCDVPLPPGQFSKLLGAQS